MPYYKGDYYRGDYYRGDPFLGAIAGLAGRAAGRLVGRASSWVARGVAGRAGKAATAVIREAAPSTVAGAAGYALGQRAAAQGTGMMRIPQLDDMPGGGRKRYRRMNPLNPKALRRALRRAEGFEKFARKTVSGLRYGPKKFKSTRRAS